MAVILVIPMRLLSLMKIKVVIYGLFERLHDSWNAFPTFAIIDHTMTVRAKPWTLDSNTNSNSCDGTNSTINGWSGGSTSDFYSS